MARKAAPALPDEVIVEKILMRLPVKLVVSFRSVCKLWNSLLSQPSLVQSLLNCSISQNPNDDYQICVTGKFRPPVGLSIFSRTNLSEIFINIVPYPECQNVIQLVGSINGLVCLATFYRMNYYFILWNPVMNLSKKILQPEDFTSKCGRRHDLFGFGWDSVENNYKIVVCATHLVQAIVYSCATDSWSNTAVSKSDQNSDNSHFWTESVNVKEICYWNFIPNFGQVLKFEARNNEFTYLRVPHSHKHVQLVNLNDRLARIEYTELKDCIIDNIDVYYLSEESSLWSKIHTNINSRIHNLKSIQSCFKSGGMIVFNGEYNMYDPKSNEIKSLACPHKEGCWYYVFGRKLSYTPSLVALEGMKSFHLCMRS